MSKTFRRKDLCDINRYVYYWVESEGLSYLLDYSEYKKIYSGSTFDKSNNEIIKDVNIFHSDKDLDYNAPKSYRKYHDRKYRKKCKRILYIINNSNEYVYDSITFPVWKKNANYSWF